MRLTLKAFLTLRVASENSVRARRIYPGQKPLQAGKNYPEVACAGRNQGNTAYLTWPRHIRGKLILA